MSHSILHTYLQRLLIGLQRGVIQKLVQTQEVADRLLELKEGRTSEPSKADRKRKRAAEDASGQVDEPSDGVAADSEEPPNPYAHWAVATEEEGAFMDDGDVSDFGDVEDGSHLGTVSHEADDSRVNSVEEDDSGMFLSSLSAGGDKAMKAVKREVFVGVDRNAAPTIIGQKKKKNRAGQMARQKRAALKFGEEVCRCSGPLQNYCNISHGRSLISMPACPGKARSRSESRRKREARSSSTAEGEEKREGTQKASRRAKGRARSAQEAANAGQGGRSYGRRGHAPIMGREKAGEVCRNSTLSREKNHIRLRILRFKIFSLTSHRPLTRMERGLCLSLISENGW